MNSERRNLLRKCIAPTRAVDLAFFISGKVLKKTLTNFFHPSFFFPKEIKIASARCRRIENYFSNSIGKVTCVFEDHNAIIKLAIGHLNIASAPDWTFTFEDHEQLVSLHRWGWLLHLLLDSPTEESVARGLSYIEDWCQKHKVISRKPIHESYTIGERISNSILFASLSKSTLPHNVQEALQNMAKHLAGNLEYYWRGEVGNHVINNARALYLHGHHFNIKAYVDLATAVLCKELIRVVTQEGFLREGSSHYQFLFTRWLLEIYRFAELHQDKQVCELLEGTLPDLVARCWFFIVHDVDRGQFSMPLIGDVSPDFTWKWLIDLPWTKLAKTFYIPSVIPTAPSQKGWGTLFGIDTCVTSSPPCTTIKNEPIFQCFYDSGWHRLDWRDLTVFWHIEPTGSPKFASHGHCDTGSFCLFWKGREVLIDAGRANYIIGNDVGEYGVGASAHNSVTVDGYDPLIFKNRSHYPDFYSEVRPIISHRSGDEEFIFSIQHDGFSRLANEKIIFQRTFTFSPSVMNIEDSFSGNRKHHVDTFFHWAPDLSIRRNKIFSADGREQAVFSTKSVKQLDERFVHNMIQSEIASFWSPNYGEIAPTSTTVISGDYMFPIVLKHTLSFLRTAEEE